MLLTFSLHLASDHSVSLSLFKADFLKKESIFIECLYCFQRGKLFSHSVKIPLAKVIIKLLTTQ